MSIKKTIIITKSSLLLEHLSENIQEYDFEVYETNAFTQALSIITMELVDLVLADVSFREQSRKVEFLEQLSKYTPPHATFIFFTGNDTDYFLIEEEAEITQTYYRIRKPVSTLELADVINKILGNG
jgi:two-component SAPR family response regulator